MLPDCLILSNFFRRFQKHRQECLRFFQIFQFYSYHFRSLHILSDPCRFFKILPSSSVFFFRFSWVEILQNALKLSQVPSDSFQFFPNISISFRFLQILSDFLKFFRDVPSSFKFFQIPSNSSRFFHFLSDSLFQILSIFLFFRIIHDVFRCFRSPGDSSKFFQILPGFLDSLSFS